MIMTCMVVRSLMLYADAKNKLEGRRLADVQAHIRRCTLCQHHAEKLLEERKFSGSGYAKLFGVKTEGFSL